MILCLLLAIVSSAEIEAPAVSAGNDELRQYLMTAADHHPGLQARYAEWQAALQRIPQARSLDDPMITYTQFLQSETGLAKIMISQKFPWLGTLLAQGKQMAAEANAALENFYSERNRLFADVKRAYFEYGFLAEQIRVAESQIQVLDYMDDVVQSKLALGIASEDELLRVSIAKTQVQDLLAGLQQMRPALSARLRETLGEEPGEDLPWPQSAALPALLPPVTEIQARIRDANPELRAYDYLIESRQKQAKAAKLKWAPDMTFGFEYAFMQEPDKPKASNAGSTAGSGMTGTGTTASATSSTMSGSSESDDDIMISLSLNLPIWYPRIRAGVREAKLMEEAAAHQKRKTTLALDAMAQRVIFDVMDAQRRHDLYEGSLLPQAQRTYESLLSRYSVDAEGNSFLDVLNSVQTLLDFQLEQSRAERDWHLGAAELEFLTGGPWPEDAAGAAAAKETPATAPAE